MSNEFLYEDDNNENFVIGIKKSSENLLFPKNIIKIIDFHSNYSLFDTCQTEIISISFEENSQISYIGEYAFSNNKHLIKANLCNCLELETLSSCLFQKSNLEEIILPEYGILHNISAGCFAFTKIRFIHFPNTIKVIEKHDDVNLGVFSNCAQLEIIDISPLSELTVIGYAFGQNTGISSFYIPKNVNSIHEGAFSLMTKLSNLTVDKDNQFYCSIDNIIYNKEMTQLHTCAPNNPITINIPLSIQTIAYEAFRTCQMTYHFTFPAQIKTVSHNGFWGSLFTSITFQNGLESIDSTSMAYTHISEITIPNTVKTIKNSAFAFSTIKNLYFKSFEQNVIISSLAFYNCPNLLSIHIPQKGIVFESSDVFLDCNMKYVYYNIKPIQYQNNVFEKRIQYKLHILSEFTQEETLQTKNNNENTNKLQLCGNIKNILFTDNHCFVHNPTQISNSFLKLQSSFFYIFILI